MTPVQIVLLVLGILGIHVVLVGFVIRWVRQVSERRTEQLRAELAAAGERVLLGPEPGLYRGATRGSGHPRSKGNGVIALTERRLIIRRLVGKAVELPTAEIVGVRTDTWFEGAWTGGRLHVIVKTRSGAELGFFAANPDAWAAALQKLARPGPGD